MQEEILKLLKENNIMLKQILAYITIQNNPNIVFQDDIKDFVINCLADRLTENNRRNF